MRGYDIRAARPWGACLGAVVGATMGLGACGDSNDSNLKPRGAPPGAYVSPPASTSSALKAASSCEDAIETLREAEQARMQRVLDANLEYALSMVNDPLGSCYAPNAGGGECGWLDGIFGGCSVAMTDSATGEPADPGSANTDAPSQGGGAERYSTTNNQVQGVDEADLIKNTGEHIYLAAGDSLTVLSAWPAEQTQIIGSTSVEGEPQQLLLAGDRIAVFSEAGNGGFCDYDEYYGGVFRGGATRLSIFDVSDPRAPILERALRVSGRLVKARLIDGTMHGVVHFNESIALPIRTWPEGLPTNLCESPLSEQDIRDRFAEASRANTTLIFSTTLADYLPSVRDADYDNGTLIRDQQSQLVSCEAFFTPDGEMSRHVLAVVSIALNDDESLGTATIFGEAGEVYASTDHLYVAKGDHRSSADSSTVIHKFALASGGSPARYLGSGKVTGFLVNQFAMDEYEGNLRVATTEWSWPTANHLFVLGEGQSGPMNILGEVRDYGLTEDIRSVRFDGDRGFVVTFKKTDPLFAFDLSDPSNPEIMGELKIPGFSTYMHLMNDDHLLTIGFDADDQGSFAWFQGVLLQIFDVTDMTDPQLVHKEVIGSRGSNSDATASHLAFNFFGDHLAIPMATCEGSQGGGAYGDVQTFDGLMVYRVSVEDGFTYVGGVDHHQHTGGGQQHSCGTWWTNPNSRVKRSIFMESYVYSLSSGHLKVSHLDTLEQDIVDVSVPPLNPIPGSGDYAYCGW